MLSFLYYPSCERNEITLSDERDCAREHFGSVRFTNRSDVVLYVFVEHDLGQANENKIPKKTERVRILPGEFFSFKKITSGYFIYYDSNDEEVDGFFQAANMTDCETKFIILE